MFLKIFGNIAFFEKYFDANKVDVAKYDMAYVSSKSINFSTDKFYLKIEKHAL